ncbi:MAG: cation transporter [Clostridia bacterium]|nr:cation transporter [Clostridia bacterium]
MEREKKIVQTSVLGIAVNLVLVAFKAAVGFIANSISVILDAVNNLSDALSSVITIIGTKLAGKKPDKKHPYGHGRIEYITSVIISVIILIAGVTAMKESVEKIISKDQASYSYISLIIIAVAVAVKFFFGRYVKKIGKSINSQALVASGSDALMDSILSLATLAAAAVNFIWGIGVEGILGAVISLIILKAGFDILIETLNSIIGIRADKELTDALKEKICSYKEVYGAYDLTLHNYGPTKIIGSVHIEVDDDMTAKQIHKLSREISTDVFMTFGIILTVGVYARETSSGEKNTIKRDLEDLLKNYPEVLQMHGFYLDDGAKTVTFDLVTDFKANAEEIRDKVVAEISAKYPEYRFFVVLDSDFSD